MDPFEARGWRKRMRKETRAVFLESPVNPTCRVLDLRPLSYLTHESGLALVVDSTFASPINFRPLEHGADVVIHSATKYLNGHHDVMGGAVLGTASYVEEVRQKMILWGQAPDPFACWLLERGLKTLDVRVQRQNENAHADRAVVRRAEGDAGGALSRADDPPRPRGGAASRWTASAGCWRWSWPAAGERRTDSCESCRIIRHAPSLGGVDSLVSEPRFTSHAHLTAEERAESGHSRWVPAAERRHRGRGRPDRRHRAGAALMADPIVIVDRETKASAGASSAGCNARIADLTLPELRRILITTMLGAVVLVLFLWMVRIGRDRGDPRADHRVLHPAALPLDPAADAGARRCRRSSRCSA